MWTVRSVLLAVFVVQLVLLVMSVQNFSVVSHRLDEVELILDERRKAEAAAKNRMDELGRAFADAERRVAGLETDVQRHREQLGQLAARLREDAGRRAEPSGARDAGAAEDAASTKPGEDAARRDNTGAAP